MDYLSTTDTAQKWGISVQRVRVLCQEDRIPGVIRVGKCYMVPANAGKPADYRRLDSVDLEAAKATPEFDMLKRCYENVPELFYLVDPATYRISYMNRTATEVFGKEGLEQICYDFVCKSDTPCAYCRIQEQVDWNVTFYHKQSERYFALFGRRIQVDGREFLGVNGFDTTNEVRLRNDVELERNRYREIVNFIPAGLGIYKKVGDDILMVWTNRYLTERTGIPGNRLLNSTIESQIEYIYPDDIDPLLNTLRSCFQTTREQNSSFRIWDYNTKQYRWFRMNVVYGNWKEGCQVCLR